MRWRLDRYSRRRGKYELVCVFTAATYEEALRRARERYPPVDVRPRLGQLTWRLYPSARGTPPREG